MTPGDAGPSCHGMSSQPHRHSLPLGLASSPGARSDEAALSQLFLAGRTLLPVQHCLGSPLPTAVLLSKDIFILTWPVLKLWGKHDPSRPLHRKHVAHPGSTWHLSTVFPLVGEKCSASAVLARELSLQITVPPASSKHQVFMRKAGNCSRTQCKPGRVGWQDRWVQQVCQWC